MMWTIPLATPSKKNSRVTDRRTGRSFPSKAYTEWHRKAALWLRTHYDVVPMGDGPWSLHLTFIHADKRRCDSDNKVSSILDLLVDLCVIPDDNWQIIKRITVDNGYEKGHPYVGIALVPLRDVTLF